MSFLTLSPPKETAHLWRGYEPVARSTMDRQLRSQPKTEHSHFNDVAEEASRIQTAASRIDAHRRKASGESPTALFRGNLGSALLFASLVADRSRLRACCWPGRCVLDRRTKTLKEIADQPPQTDIFRRQIFHLHDGRNVEAAKTPAPAIESSQRYSGGTADFSHGHAGACLIEQMKNFTFSESGPSHRIALG